MPIHDYRKVAKRREEILMADPSISERNKEILKRFLTIYDVSPGRLDIFIASIRHLLRIDPDISIAIHAPDTIALGFRQLREKYSPATYLTIHKASARFIRWLNDGTLPCGFKDIKAPPRASMRRKLQPDDMVTWEDGVELARQSTSIQLQAIFLTQLDGGFRPSEFVDLDYGDITIQDHLVLVHVKSGKTGSRIVILYRAAPYLLRWLHSHPTKKATDPLWIYEGPGTTTSRREQIERYAYPAIVKRIKMLRIRNTRIYKPLDFYNLRHSSCALDKRDNLPLDLAANRHGHSVKHFTGTYGRLSTKDLTDRFSKHYGLQSTASEPIENWSCPACRRLNPPTENHCFSCGHTDDQESSRDKPIVSIRERLARETALRINQLHQHHSRETELQGRLDQFETAIIELAKQEIERFRTNHSS